MGDVGRSVIARLPGMLLQREFERPAKRSEILLWPHSADFRLQVLKQLCGG
jgi:hypothetical protein